MNLRFASLCAAPALVLFTACKDSTTTAAARSAGPRPSLAIVSDTVGGGGGPGNQSHFVANGSAGSVSWFVSGGSRSPSDSGGGGGGFIFGSLGVSRGGPTNSPQTFLSYFIEQCDPFVGCTFLGGSGLIPNGGGLACQRRVPAALERDHRSDLPRVAAAFHRCLDLVLGQRRRERGGRACAASQSRQHRDQSERDHRHLSLREDSHASHHARCSTSGRARGLSGS